MTSTPRISIIVPSYNHRRFLPMRMESILNQTRQDFELILLDDASPDGSSEFLKTFLNRPHVRLFANETNTGSPFAQWNRGISEARGELVWIAESDDVAEPQFLEVLAGILEQQQSVGLAFCRSKRIDEDGNVLPETTIVAVNALLQNDFLMEGSVAIRGPLYLSNLIVSASAVVFRRSLYDQAGPASTEFRLAGDWLQWCKMMLMCDIAYVAQSMSSSRIHTNTRRQSTFSSGTLELESMAVEERIREIVEVDRAQVRQGAERLAVSWLQAMRAGRFSGSLWRHPVFFLGLVRADLMTALLFASRWPYAFVVWFVKRFLLSFKRVDH